MAQDPKAQDPKAQDPKAQDPEAQDPEAQDPEAWATGLGQPSADCTSEERLAAGLRPLSGSGISGIGGRQSVTGAEFEVSGGDSAKDN